MFLELKSIHKSFDGLKVVENLDLSLEKGQLLCILGSSGCGKTTTLNMIGGFLIPDAGTIELDGADITTVPPEKRPVSTVFQSYGMFPHMTVLENVIYGLKFRGFKKRQAREKGMHYLEMVGLQDYANARIHEISGGQQQRTALARALIVEPKLCLLDEPFSNLDAALRVKMRKELKQLQQELGITMVFVTHDQEEAMLLSDQMAIMEQGRLIQMGSPEEIFRNPANEFVSSFLSLSSLRWEDDGTLLKVIKEP